MYPKQSLKISCNNNIDHFYSKPASLSEYISDVSSVAAKSRTIPDAESAILDIGDGEKEIVVSSVRHNENVDQMSLALVLNNLLVELFV